MPRNLANMLACLLVGGCAVSTERQGLGYGEYARYSCEQLAQEAVRLMRQTVSRSEHLLEDDKARREATKLKLKDVKRVSAQRRC